VSTEISTETNPTTGLRLDLLGPMVEFLTSPQEANIDFRVLRGMIPPGVSVPLPPKKTLQSGYASRRVKLEDH
jgi:hypothetical protein